VEGQALLISILPALNEHRLHMGVSIWGCPNSWMVYFMKKQKQKGDDLAKHLDTQKKKEFSAGDV
jgi:spore coat polysaccharide biosynthesis protein SpsF (cytidylyltransferase family)